MHLKQPLLSSTCRGCEAEGYEVQSSAHGVRVVQNKDENHNLWSSQSRH